MKHEDAVLLLDGLVVGDVDPEVVGALTSHIASCETCRELTGTLEILSPTGAPAGAAVHPESDEIVAYASGPSGLGVDALTCIAAHLKGCETCRSEVDTVRRADAAALRGDPILAGRTLLGAAGARRSWNAAVLAAAAVVLILGYPAYLGLRRYSETVRAARSGEAREREVGEENRRLRDRIADVEAGRAKKTEPASAFGPVVLNFLKSPLRGTSPAIPSFKVAGRSLPIALDLDPRTIARGPERYRFEVVSGSEVRWSIELAGTEVRDYLDSPQGAVILAIPADALGSGAYLFRVVSAGGAGRPIFSAPFKVDR